MTSISIDQQFNGPDNSGNGGYCCGRVAGLLPAPGGTAIEVTLHSPPPLNTPMQANVTEQAVEVLNGDLLVATARPSSLTLDIPAAPSPEQAELASKNYRGFTDHPYAHCFVCGPQRQTGDGLGIFAGAVDNPKSAVLPVEHWVACCWQPFAGLADEQGFVGREFIWAALDCPSYFAVSMDKPDTRALLGRLTLQIFQPQIAIDQRYIISAWSIAREGRKMLGGAALYSQQGDCLAASKAIWIDLQRD